MSVAKTRLDCDDLDFSLEDTLNGCYFKSHRQVDVNKQINSVDSEAVGGEGNVAGRKGVV